MICGIPVIHYDHIENYADVREHTAENITLLCPTHHQEKTSKRLSADRVRKFNADPYALRHPMKASHHLTYFGGSTFNLGIGSNLFTYESAWGGDYPSPGAIVVDMRPVLSGRVLDEEILISAVIRDVDNRLVLLIRDNEMKVGGTVWDVTLAGEHLRIWWKQMDLGIDIRFAEDGLYIERGDFYANGYCFHVGPDRRLKIGKAEFEHCEFTGTGIWAGTGADLQHVGLGVGVGEEERYRPIESIARKSASTFGF